MKNNILLLLAALLISGCPKTSLLGSGPNNAGEFQTGIKYYLPESGILLESKITSTSTKDFHFKPDSLIGTAQGGRQIEICYQFPNPEVETVVKVQTISWPTYPDKSYFYTLNLEPGVLSEGSLTIQRSKSGILQNIAVDARGKLGDVVVNGAKAIASIAGSFLGIPKTPKSVLSVARNREDENKETAIEKQPVYCGEWLNNELGRIGVKYNDPLTKLQKYSMMVDNDIKNLWKSINLGKKSLSALKNKLDNKRIDLTTEEQNQTSQISNVIKQIEEQVYKKELELASEIKLFDGKVSAISKERGLGVKMTVKNITHLLKLSSIPLDKYADGNEPEWAVDLGFYITLKPLTDYNGPRLQISMPNLVGKVKSKEHLVFYRDKSPFLYNVYLKSFNGFQLTNNSGYASLYEPKETPSAIDFKTSSSSERNLQLTFTDDGTLTNYNFTYTSSAKALAENAKNAATGALESYQNSVVKIAAIKETKRKDKLAELQLQLDSVTKKEAIASKDAELQGTLATANSSAELASLHRQKELLDAEISLLGSNPEYESELIGLQHQLALSNAQVAALNVDPAHQNALLELQRQKMLLDSEISILTTKSSDQLANQASTVQLNQLQRQIELLAKEMELMRKQQEMAELKRASEQR